ncbi:hypothetical protein AV530_018777 [Patagioenas fasciata monilis]|uniref:Uncharacterized protein n=1 Tax=Patagioenas fasciata monilis TaxID=372326 RepID=A0A1V4JJG5_PATFA|nr:hypothetical protein AV530_018777 [Patagioenas fasciata monilis]
MLRTSPEMPHLPLLAANFCVGLSITCKLNIISTSVSLHGDKDPPCGNLYQQILLRKSLLWTVYTPKLRQCTGGEKTEDL